MTAFVDQAARLRTLAANVTGGSASADPVRSQAGAGSCPVIALASGKGGVGKTSLSVNLSIALARRGRAVTLLDADPGLANADVLCGLSPARRLDSALYGAGASASVDLRAVAMQAPGGFRLVPGSVGAARLADLTDADCRRLVGGLASVEAEQHAVLIDCGAGLGRSVTSLMWASDACALVVTPEPTSIADAYALLKLMITNARGRSLHAGLIVNGCQSAREGERVYRRLSGVLQRFLSRELAYLGAVRHDDRVGDAIRRRRPLLLDRPRAAASKDIERLAESVASFAGVRL